MITQIEEMIVPGVFKQTIDNNDFEKVDIRVGTIVSAEDFLEARIPAFKLTIDFGDFGIKKSSAQITSNYDVGSLLGQQVIAVVNFKPKQIGPMLSEVLTLGVPNQNNKPILLQPTKKVPNGGKLY